MTPALPIRNHWLSRAARGEPDGVSPNDFVDDRLSRLVRQALESNHVSLGRVAEVPGLTPMEMPTAHP